MNKCAISPSRPGNATNIITFEVGGEVTTQAYKLAAEIIANATTIDGWQKKDAKKVPPSIVLSTVGRKQMYGCAVDAVLETEVQKAIEKSGVKAIGSTSLVGEKEEYVLRRFQPGEPITFKARPPRSSSSSRAPRGWVVIAVGRLELDDRPHPQPPKRSFRRSACRSALARGGVSSWAERLRRQSPTATPSVVRASANGRRRGRLLVS